MPAARINGTSIEYVSTGDGPPLALLNGIMMSISSWGAQTAALSASYRCILHDFRGQLRSGKEPPVSMEQHCDDFAALLDVIGIAAPVHLVGTSYGGEVAMEFAIRYPERTRSLTVIACVARPDAGLLAKVEAGRDAALNAPATLYDVSAADFFSPEFATANQALMARSREGVASLPRDFFEGYAALCDSFAKLDVLDRLSAIRCPTLVIAADRDRLKPVRFSRDIAARIPAAELRVVANSGHAAVVEQPREIDDLVGKFLSRLP